MCGRMAPESERSIYTRAGADSGRVVGLFAGIGGIELGLHRSGFRTRLLCEIDDAAQQVLRSQDPFREVPLHPDVTRLESLPDVEVVTAGFPCQDLSQAGRAAGIEGRRSGLVEHVFRLLADPRVRPRWVVVENVPFMLQLHRGRAMHHLVDRFEELGMRWAYRIIDARSFGRPQRRRRVVLLASADDDPREALFAEDHGVEPPPGPGEHYGFYWTEGRRGLGWAPDAVPTLKGGSAVSIPSAPAVWRRSDGMIGTPDIRDAERLQGFPEDWTSGAHVLGRRRGDGPRWKLVGNAVSVPLASWLGGWLASPGRYDGRFDEEVRIGDRWPRAAWGGPGIVTRRAEVSEWPVQCPLEPLGDFLSHELEPLSHRAIAGFNRRANQSALRFDPDFLRAIHEYESRAKLGLGGATSVPL